jgi:LPS-assembly lipoprotein
MMRFVLLLVLAAALCGCGLQPLYSGGAAGPVASMLENVDIAPIQGKAGYLVRGALGDRLKAAGNGEARFRLDVKLDDKIEGFGLRTNDTVTRERRTLRARYQLVDLATGKTVLDDTAGSDAGIDVVGSEYATIAGENTALENLSQTVAQQILLRLTLYARTQK